MTEVGSARMVERSPDVIGGSRVCSVECPCPACVSGGGASGGDPSGALPYRPGRALSTYIGIVPKALAVASWPTYSAVKAWPASSDRRAAKASVT